MKPSKKLINEDVTVIAWILGIKEWKQSINLVQLNMKVIELTQTKLIAFQEYQIIASGIGSRENIHKLAKHKVELLIHILLSTMICKHCTKNMITQHTMEFKQSISIQACKQFRTKVIVRRGSNQMYNTIPKS
jgi:hypothetical protein